MGQNGTEPRSRTAQGGTELDRRTEPPRAELSRGAGQASAKHLVEGGRPEPRPGSGLGRAGQSWAGAGSRGKKSRPKGDIGIGVWLCMSGQRHQETLGRDPPLSPGTSTDPHSQIQKNVT